MQYTIIWLIFVTALKSTTQRYLDVVKLMQLIGNIFKDVITSLWSCVRYNVAHYPETDIYVNPRGSMRSER